MENPLDWYWKWNEEEEHMEESDLAALYKGGYA